MKQTKHWMIVKRTGFWEERRPYGAVNNTDLFATEVEAKAECDKWNKEPKQ